MQVRINPSEVNTNPLAGLLIKSSSIAYCLKEIQQLKWELKQIRIFPVPGTSPNQIWGCLVVPDFQIDKEKTRMHEWLQIIGSVLFIPAAAKLYPPLNETEIRQLFRSELQLFHPEIGLVELTETLDFNQILTLPQPIPTKITKPASSVFIPKEIISFQIQAIPAEEALAALEENFFPKKEKMKRDGLNPIERIKLSFYRLLFEKTGKGNNLETRPNRVIGKLSTWLGTLFPGMKNWIKKIEYDFQDLEKRNQKQIDKFLDLMKTNPLEALKYAIPLDEQGSSRGILENGRFDLLERWFDFSTTDRSSYGSGRTINLGSHYDALEKQYRETAAMLLENKEYQKAAFVYLKLLKDYSAAAQALEDGGYYQEAAAIYLNQIRNKTKAALCYEKGRMIGEAIAIYKELHEDEKVGDLYMLIQNKEQAYHYFEKTITRHKQVEQYFQAAMIYQQKIKDIPQAQKLLLEGWRGNKETFNCLNSYVNNIEDQKVLMQELERIKMEEVNLNNSKVFLQVIQYEYLKNTSLSPVVKEMAYEIVAAQIQKNPDLVSELKGFNPGDKEFIKDTIRFKIGKKR